VAASARRLGRLAPLLLLAFLSSGAGACSGTPRIEIDGLEARLSPMVKGVCSIFLKIANAGNGDDTLLGAAVDVPGAITEVHDVRDGRMVRSARTPVPAREVVELRPGGLHIMVFNLPGDVGAGHELGLRLLFASSGERRASVRIR
jgi:copper(I)-binding protein